LLTGRAGVALALMEAARATGASAWATLARETLAGCAAVLSNVGVVKHVGGGVAGAGGVIHALARCAAAHGCEESRQRAVSLLDLIHSRQLWRRQGEDRAAGRAGLVDCIHAGGLAGEAGPLLAVLAAAGPTELGPGRRYAASAAPLLA